MTEWTMNTTPSPLATGMLIRRPGIDEALEVVKVTSTEFKIKLPNGKSSTLPLGAEVEWSWPETKGAGKPKAVPEDAPEPDRTTESDSDWLTDWTLLDVGTKIEVLGEKGDFTILRLNDSSARIKHNATGQIQPLSIGHKFKILETAKSAKPSKGKGKVKASKKPEPVHQPEPVDLPFEEPETEIDDNEPSDEALAAIENGDDETEIEDTDDTELDPASLDDLDDTDDNDTDDSDEDNDSYDNDPDTEDNDMPAPTRSTTSRSTAARSTKRSTRWDRTALERSVP